MADKLDDLLSTERAIAECRHYRVRTVGEGDRQVAWWCIDCGALGTLAVWQPCTCGGAAAHTHAPECPRSRTGILWQLPEGAARLAHEYRALGDVAEALGFPGRGGRP